MSKSKNNKLAIVLLVSLFFFWGFIHNLNPVLIPHLRIGFELSNFQASLVDSAVFIAYFIMAIPAGFVMQKYGYKSGIIIGLIFFSIGCFLFVPAANTMNYIFFLTALFVVSCGLATLETAANPYMTQLGDPKTGPQRLNFAQSFNGLAAFIAPLIGGNYILTKDPKPAEELASMTESAKLAYLQMETSSVKMPYVILGLVLLLLVVIFYFTRLPDFKEEEAESKNVFSALKHKSVSLAVLAQFFYIGAQVCILSFLILFATDAVGIAPQKASAFAAYAGLAFMIGRFAGTFLMRYFKPSLLLSIYAAVNLALTLYVIVGEGPSTVYTLIVIAFFMSIMFPTIFALGVQGIKQDTKAASSLIVMSIVGGAVLPPVFGYIADASQNLHYGYIVPAVSFAVVLIFALASAKFQVSENKEAVQQ